MPLLDSGDSRDGWNIPDPAPDSDQANIAQKGHHNLYF